MDETNGDRKHKFHECQICDKQDENVITFGDGLLMYAHEDCAELAKKVVGIYLNYLGSTEGGLIALALDFLESEGYTTSLS